MGSFKIKKRRKYSSEDKMNILKRHLVDKENISDICEDLSLHPNQFYKWQSELFNNGHTVFEKPRKLSSRNTEMKKVEEEKSALEKSLQQKDSVIAEITEDYVRLKKKVLGR